jgi:glycosyltransferase involved in cell wall biosynthesis
MFLSLRRLPAIARNIALWFEVVRDDAAIAVWTQYFDAAYYLRTNPDVAERCVDPFLHFLVFGTEERRRPSALFDIGYYLACRPDVARLSLNALLHYALFGRSEGRILHDSPRIIASNSQDSATAYVTVNNNWRPDLPVLSVVIPCFNYGQYVEAAICSVMDQTLPGVEILVIEGGSTDGSTPAKLKEIESRRPAGVTFFYREGRHLAGDNRNFGIARARGRYVCCLDADDLLSPIYLEVALFLAEGYGYDIVYPSSQSFGESDIPWYVRDASFPEIAEENQISTVAVFRRSEWAEAGGFRDWGVGEKHVPEDWDFWVRLMGRGCRAKSIQSPLFLYRVHKHGLTGTTELGHSRQREVIRDANSNLLREYVPAGATPLKISQRWDNLDGASDYDSRQGFLLALPFVTIGGAETLLYTLAQEVCRRNLRLVVITSQVLPDSVPDKWKSFIALTPHVYPLAHLFHDPGVPEDFLHYLVRRYRVSYLFLAGCKLVYDLLPDLKLRHPKLKIIDQLFNDGVHASENRRNRAHIDATVVPSDILKAALAERTPESPGFISVIPHSVTIPDIESRSLNSRRTEFGWPPDKVVIGFFGRLSEEKGGEVFIEMARRLAHDDRFFFVMTGEGPCRRQMMKQVARYGLTGILHMPGFVEDVDAYLNAVDIVVVPSLLDGMPLVVLEAQVREKPVVASSVGSIPVMISEGLTGYLCSPGDVPAFCRRVVELAADPALRAAMGRAGRAEICRRYGAESMLRAYFEVFRQASDTPSEGGGSAARG